MGNDDTARGGASGRGTWTVRWLVALLVVGFTAHNVEELLRNEAHMAALTGGGRLDWWSEGYRTDRFVVAVVLLTVAVVALLARVLLAWSATRPRTTAGLLVAGAVLAVPAIVGSLLLSALVVR